MMRNLSVYLFMVSACLFTACTKTVQSQVDEYIVFYYPTTGEAFYDITYDWGSYLINTGGDMNDEVHANSKPYLGYITLRPIVDGEASAPEEALPTYIITPEGEVWLTDGSGIAEASSRDEVVVEGSSTTTTTINSRLEPVVDHFKNSKSEWVKYADIEGSEGNYKLKKAE